MPSRLVVAVRNGANGASGQFAGVSPGTAVGPPRCQMPRPHPADLTTANRVRSPSPPHLQSAPTWFPDGSESRPAAPRSLRHRRHILLAVMAPHTRILANEFQPISAGAPRVPGCSAPVAKDQYNLGQGTHNNENRLREVAICSDSAGCVIRRKSLASITQLGGLLPTSGSPSFRAANRRSDRANGRPVG